MIISRYKIDKGDDWWSSFFLPQSIRKQWHHYQYGSRRTRNQTCPSSGGGYVAPAPQSKAKAGLMLERAGE